MKFRKRWLFSFQSRARGFKISNKNSWLWHPVLRVSIWLCSHKWKKKSFSITFNYLLHHHPLATSNTHCWKNLYILAPLATETWWIEVEQKKLKGSETSRKNKHLSISKIYHGRDKSTQNAKPRENGSQYTHSCSQDFPLYSSVSLTELPFMYSSTEHSPQNWVVLWLWPLWGH